MSETVTDLLRGAAPRALKTRVFRAARGAIARGLLAREAAMPRTDLEARHLEGARLLPDRQALLAALPAGGRVAEIGVAAGDFSADILRLARPERLVLVDAWHSERYGDPLMEGVRARFAEELAAGRVEIRRGLSTEVCPRLENGAFDWVYLDTDHSYETTRRELEILADKVRPEGWICGHDYVSGYWPHLLRYGVVEAVHEFCARHGWRIACLTVEQRVTPSFALRRI